MSQTINYSLQREAVWERLILIKDRRTRRVRKPTKAAACIKVGLTSYYLPSAITTEGGLLLFLNPQQTKWLADGEYAWDGVATVSRSQSFTSQPDYEDVVFKGTITVSTYANITPLAVDTLPATPLQAVV